jgi:hypothetical protein
VNDHPTDDPALRGPSVKKSGAVFDQIPVGEDAARQRAKTDGRRATVAVAGERGIEDDGQDSVHGSLGWGARAEANLADHGLGC